MMSGYPSQKFACKHQDEQYKAFTEGESYVGQQTSLPFHFILVVGIKRVLKQNWCNLEQIGDCSPVKSISGSPSEGVETGVLKILYGLRYIMMLNPETLKIFHCFSVNCKLVGI